MQRRTSSQTRQLKIGDIPDQIRQIPLTEIRPPSAFPALHERCFSNKPIPGLCIYRDIGTVIPDNWNIVNNMANRANFCKVPKPSQEMRHPTKKPGRKSFFHSRQILLNTRILEFRFYLIPWRAHTGLPLSSRSVIVFPPYFTTAAAMKSLPLNCISEPVISTASPALKEILCLSR